MTSLASDNGQRLGCFRIRDRHVRGRALFDSDDIYLIAEMMNGSVVTDCKYDYMTQSFEYVALHPSFKMIERGGIAPMYHVAWQGSRMVLIDHVPEVIEFECPSRNQTESWLKTMQRVQREHPTKEFRPEYP